MPKFGNHQLSIRIPSTSLAQGVNISSTIATPMKQRSFLSIQDMFWLTEMARGVYRPYSSRVSDYMLNLVISTLITKIALLASSPWSHNFSNIFAMFSRAFIVERNFEWGYFSENGTSGTQSMLRCPRSWPNIVPWIITYHIWVLFLGTNYYIWSGSQTA